MISIVDYGLGNIFAFTNIYKKLNVTAKVVSTKEQLQTAEKIILPGVGSFDWAMTRLNNSGMRDTLDNLVLEKKVPVLGVCVGMQMMANGSDEGESVGLRWINAEVKKFDEAKFIQATHLPHMGWNDAIPQRTDCLFRGLEVASRFYFLHSYCFLPQKSNEILAATDYNGHFTSAVRSENVFGVQFHPEKSHQWGMQLLKNFAEI